MGLKSIKIRGEISDYDVDNVSFPIYFRVSDGSEGSSDAMYYKYEEDFMYVIEVRGGNEYTFSVVRWPIYGPISERIWNNKVGRRDWNSIINKFKAKFSFFE